MEDWGKLLTVLLVGAGALVGGFKLLASAAVASGTKTLDAVITQNSALTTAIENMAKVVATGQENTINAIHELATEIGKAGVVRDERDRSIFKALERTEQEARKAANVAEATFRRLKGSSS